MGKRFKAIIYWLPEKQGGRKEIPTGDKYAPIIKVKGSAFMADEFWSIFVLNTNFLQKNETIAELEYLSSRAPNNLKEGVKFELFEGRKLVAKGTILEELS